MLERGEGSYRLLLGAGLLLVCLAFSLLPRLPRLAPLVSAILGHAWEASHYYI